MTASAWMRQKMFWATRGGKLPTVQRTSRGREWFIVTVIYGDQPSQAPSERVRDLNGESDDINYQYGGKFVWLVPRYTTQRNVAVIAFEMAIQDGADGSLKDLAKGAGGDFRYLLPIKDVTDEAKVTQVALLRLNGGLGQRPAGWSGNTIDINKDHGKTFLYLLWKTAV